MVCCSIFQTDKNWNCLTYLPFYFLPFIFTLLYFTFLYCIAYTVYDVRTVNIIVCVSCLCVSMMLMLVVL
jgi:hypothetical protein